ncbi:hypothetical protein K491DRAFT_605612 [Lophiostoma macrostomum CBS 122681]|uniref:Eisosome protein 1 n=1 Tax=Lophiostoma macrostomum CBS 122681 TaxID=1314788 RepID=A0A6A6SWW0_9PLEO|nr:hypothetical protein K491DRAFT_605612 [Lophiostoma macrostomum CBS 122681]
MRCPDPSAHQTKDRTLQDHASAAALYSTGATKGNTRESAPRDVNPLGADGKLSSASAATSLKHARAHELPSFPIVGIDTQSSAGAAANLANANTKSPEWWKPEHSSAAGKAALLANNYKMQPQWKPEASAAGSKAALLAHQKSTGHANTWMPEPTAEGNSAANIAMRKQRAGPSGSALDGRHADDGKNKALVAATGAVSSAGRKRSQSTPAPPALYPDSQNSAKNALSAATLAASPSTKHQPMSSNAQASPRSGALEAARIQHAKSIPRDMYTDHPPVALEVQEQKHNDALQASAVSMAKVLYDREEQRKHDGRHASRSQAQTGATAAQSHQQQHGGEDPIREQAIELIGVQAAAQKLAAQRLANIGPDENAKFRSYYGYDKPSRSKLSIRRGRNRASSNPDPEPADSDSDEDDFRSRRIRNQMNQLNQSVAEIDAKKREQDRKSLMDAAFRKVQKDMQGLDQQVFDKTGKMSPAMIDEWDAKAKAKAAANSEARMENHGRVHIGHGQYMDQAEIDAIAQARVQPTLDEIADKTEKRRAEEEERRLELEAKRREEHREKERAAEIRAEERRVKDEEKKAAKMRTTEEKAAVKQEQEAEKEKRAEEKQPRGEEHHPAVAGNDDNDLYRDPTPAGQPAQQSDPDSGSVASPTSPTSPAKSDGKGFKGFLKKFKRRSKHNAATAEADKPGFIGGAALRGSSSHSNSNRNDSAPTSPHPPPALASNSDGHYSDVSSISTDANGDRGRAPKRTASGISAVSGTSDYSEARDAFDPDVKLPPPPVFGSTDAAAGRKGSPSRDSRFTEIGI